MKRTISAKRFAVLAASMALSTACADSPKAVVGPDSDLDRGIDNLVGQPVTTNAVKFVGTDFFGQTCDAYLTFHNGSWIVDSDVTLHGQELPSLSLQEWDYTPAGAQYKQINPTVGFENTPALASAVLFDENEIVDMNKIAQYRRSFDLAYTYRMEMNSGMTFDQFVELEEAMEEVEADATQFAAHQDKFAAVERLFYITYHVGHYDSFLCNNLSAVGAVEVTFEQTMPSDDDDHDHDHGHDDDHDHDDDHGHDDDHDHDHDDDHGHDDDHDHDHDHGHGGH